MHFKRSLMSVAVAAATLSSVPSLAKSVNQQDAIKALFKSSRHQLTETLAHAARKAKKLIGAAVSEGVLASGEAAYLDVLEQEFDYITPENSGKWGPLQPAPGEWDFTTHDNLVDWTNLNGKFFKGHTLVWHSQAPSFISNELTAAEMQSFIDEHVHTTVSRYTGEFYGWDVVNEAVADDGSMRNSALYQVLGTDFISNAFFSAKALDPKARLYYNDYNIAGINAKSDAVYQLLSDLKNNGVPVNGIGFQMHLAAGGAPAYQTLVDNFQRFADLGLNIAISELDVRIANLPWDAATNLAIQQQVYHTVVSACMKLNKCETITTWGLTDKYSWIDSTFAADDPLPFDESYQRKPAFYGMVDGFSNIKPDAQGTLPNLIANGQFEAGADGWTSWNADITRVAAKDYLPELEEDTCPADYKLNNGGDSALLVSNRAEAWNSAVYDISQLIHPGRVYVGEVFTKLVNTESDAVTLSAQVSCVDTDPQFFNLASATANDTTWSALAGQFSVPECDIESAVLYVQGPAASTDFLIDKVSLRPDILVPNTDGLGPNIVANTDFESGADWWFGFGDASVTASTDVANSGSQSGFVSGRTDTWQGPATSLLDAIEPGTDYRIFAWVRSAEEDIQVNATLAAGCPDGTQFNFISSVSANSNGWSLLSGEFTSPTCELNDLTLYMEGPAAGVEFYIDDVNVRQVLSSADDNGNLISNGDFENGISGWTSWGGTLGASPLANSGDQSILLTERTGTWQGPLYDLLPHVVPGEEYHVNAAGRIANITEDSLNITIKTACDDGTEAYNQLTSVTANNSDWSNLSGSIVLPQCNLTEVFLYFDGPAIEADILIDDVYVSGAPAGDPNNLVSNSDFETGTAGWVAWAGSLGISDDGHSGEQSAILSGRTDTWQGPVYSLLNNVEAAGTYQFNAWGKVAGSTSETMNITVKTTCESGEEAYHWVGGNSVTDTEWTELSGSLTLPDCSLTEVSLYFDGPAAGVDSLIDDVSVTPVD